MNKKIQNLKESYEDKILEEGISLKQSSKKGINLAENELLFRPPVNLSKIIEKQLNFLKSYKLLPSSGSRELRDKIIKSYEEKRGISLPKTSYDSLITDSSEQIIFLAIISLVKDDEEVCLISPYQEVYNDLAKVCSENLKIIETKRHNNYEPSIEDIREQLTDKTKVIILNSPNNPAGIHYGHKWMKDFCKMLKDFPKLYVISDEVYSDISYFDPKPSYFYSLDESFLDRVLILNGIDFSLAARGLKLNYCLANKKLIHSMSLLQSRISSGANSLIQNALIEYDLSETDSFSIPVEIAVRKCAQILRDSYVDNGMSSYWYQINSGIHAIIDFTHFPFFEGKSTEEDHSVSICSEVLEKFNILLVPGTSFGIPNCARVSLVVEDQDFKDGLKLLMSYFFNKS